MSPKKNIRERAYPYVDVNARSRYQRFYKQNKKRVQMQRAIKRIITKRVLLPSKIETLILHVALDHKALIKHTTNSITTRIKSKEALYKQLRYHFSYMCKISGYRFPPTNFDVGVARLLNRPSPTTIIRPHRGGMS